MTGLNSTVVPLRFSARSWRSGRLRATQTVMAVRNAGYYNIAVPAGFAMLPAARVQEPCLMTFSNWAERTMLRLLASTPPALMAIASMRRSIAVTSSLPVSMSRAGGVR